MAATKLVVLMKHAMLGKELVDLSPRRGIVSFDARKKTLGVIPHSALHFVALCGSEDVGKNDEAVLRELVGDARRSSGGLLGGLLGGLFGGGLHCCYVVL